MAYDLKFDGLAVDVDGADLKVHTYRAQIALCVGILSEPQEQTRLNLKTLSLLGTPVD